MKYRSNHGVLYPEVLKKLFYRGICDGRCHFIFGEDVHLKRTRHEEDSMILFYATMTAHKLNKPIYECLLIFEAILIRPSADS